MSVDRVTGGDDATIRNCLSDKTVYSTPYSVSFGDKESLGVGWIKSRS